MGKTGRPDQALAFNPTASASISNFLEYARSATTLFSQLINSPAESVMLLAYCPYQHASRSSEQVSGEAYKGKDIVKANDIPRRTSNATAAMFKNCKNDQSQHKHGGREMVQKGSQKLTPSYQRVKAEDE